MTQDRIDSLSVLHPEFGRRVKILNTNLALGYKTGLTKTNFKIFESFRHADRQARLLKEGVSKSRAWESAHQWGFAVDLVPYLTIDEAQSIASDTGVAVEAGWNWHASNDYSFLATTAQAVGLSTPISWDPCHVQSPDWQAYLVGTIRPLILPYMKK